MDWGRQIIGMPGRRLKSGKAGAHHCFEQKSGELFEERFTILQADISSRLTALETGQKSLRDGIKAINKNLKVFQRVLEQRFDIKVPVVEEPGETASGEQNHCPSNLGR